MMTRCFLAVGVHGALGRALTAVADDLRADMPDWAREKWVRPENLHVTLRFFGPLDQDRLVAVMRAIADTAPSVPRFQLSFKRFEASPSTSRCRVIWAAYHDESDHFAKAVNAFDAAACDAGGIEPETRPPRPHVTLCRSRRPRPVSRHHLAQATAHLRAVAPVMSVPTVTLYASRLRPDGPTYEEVGSWVLGEETTPRQE